MAGAVVVTGVSTGIGRAIAVALAAAEFRVFGSVRSEGDAAAFAAAVPGSTALRFDVTDDAAIAAAAAEVRAAVGSAGLAGLVNNAGIAVAGPLEHLPLDRFRQQLAVNLTGVLAVTQAFLPMLRAANPRGRIVNISSVAGRTALPYVGPYSASKFGLEAMSDALRRELRGEGITVTVIAPAAVDTPIWGKGTEGADAFAATPHAGTLDRMLTMGLEAGRGGLKPEAVAQAVLQALTNPRPRIRQVLSGSPFTSWLMPKLPARFLDRMIARALRGRR